MPTFSIDRVTKVAAAGAVIATFMACGEGTPEEGETAEVAGTAGSSCVADYADTPCDLLTAELVRGELPDAPAGIEQESYSGSSFSSCTYTWPSDRVITREVAGRTMEYPESNTVVLSWIDTFESDDPGAMFRRQYLPTEEELQRAAEAMEQEVDEQAEERGLSESEREMARGLGEGLASSMSFEPVDGVGDLASWNANYNDLYVLSGDTKFQVNAIVSPAGDENRRAAIDIAEALMAACE